MTQAKTLDDTTLNAWKHHEDIAMHFNDLILRVRTQALGALAAILTFGGIALKEMHHAGSAPWGIVASTLGFLLAFWIAIWVLDFGYYNRLLLGAVDALLELEVEIANGEPIKLQMSHRIEDSVLGRPPRLLVKGKVIGPTIFYSIVTGSLGVGTLYAAFRYWCA